MIVRLLISLILFFIFGTLAFLLHEETSLGRQSVSWPTTRATLKEASLGVKKSHFSYSFAIGQSTFKGHKLEFCMTIDEELREYFRQHIQNKKVITVSYNPLNPAQNVIRPGMDDRQFTFYLILVGGFLCFAYAFDRLVTGRSRRKGQALPIDIARRDLPA